MKNIGIVWGYLPNIDKESPVAEAAQLHQRFSIVVNRYPDTAPGTFDIEFNKDLAQHLFRPLLQYLEHDRMEACDYFDKIHQTFDDALIFDEESKEDKTFKWIKLFQNEELICYIEHEDYENWGGPHPYHDAFVYALYLQYIERIAFQRLLFQAIIKHDITVTEIISGLLETPAPPENPPTRWWERLLDWSLGWLID